MPTYSYRATDNDNKEVMGTVEAASPEAAKQALEDRNLEVIDLRESMRIRKTTPAAPAAPKVAADPNKPAGRTILFAFEGTDADGVVRRGTMQSFTKREAFDKLAKESGLTLTMLSPVGTTPAYRDYDLMNWQKTGEVPSILPTPGTPAARPAARPAQDAPVPVPVRVTSTPKPAPAPVAPPVQQVPVQPVPQKTFAPAPQPKPVAPSPPQPKPQPAPTPVPVAPPPPQKTVAPSFAASVPALMQTQPPAPVSNTSGYAPLIGTLRLYAGWLLAWYAVFVALGYYAHVRALPWDIPFVEAFFLSPLVFSFITAAFLLLVMSSIQKSLRGGIFTGAVLTIIGVAAVTYVRMSVV